MRTKTVRFVLIPLVVLVGAALGVGACAGAGDEEAAPAPAEAGGFEESLEAEGITRAVDSGGSVAAEPAAPAEAAPPAEPAPAAEAPLGEALPISAGLPPVEPRVIQNASVSITVPKGDFDETIQRARQIADTYGGFVTSETSSQGVDQRLVRGMIVVRVPYERYEDALEQLESLGKIVARNSSGTDVSLQYVDLEARARHLEAVEQQLLGFLNQTTTVADALVIQQRLNEVQLQLEEIRGQLRYLDDQSSFATIALEVAERGVPVGKPKEDDGGWGFADAWHAAARGFETIIGGVFVALVTAGPILAALVLAFFGGRAYFKRRKPLQPGGPAETPGM
jgi:hypothetical protein